MTNKEKRSLIEKIKNINKSPIVTTVTETGLVDELLKIEDSVLILANQLYVSDFNSMNITHSTIIIDNFYRSSFDVQQKIISQILDNVWENKTLVIIDYTNDENYTTIFDAAILNRCILLN
jgi:hypothetical protein